MANANKKDEVVEQPSVVEQPKEAPIQYFHVDEFLSKREEKLSQEIVKGFKIFLKGGLYQTSLEAFEGKLKAFYERFNKKN